MFVRSAVTALAAAAMLAGLAGAASAAGPQQKANCTVREGVEFHRMKNYGKALECWEENARHGSSAAQYNIARMYALGEGVPHSKVNAYKWMAIAAKAGRPEATKALDQLKAKMTPVELEEAQRRIQEFYTSGRR